MNRMILVLMLLLPACSGGGSSASVPPPVILAQVASTPPPTQTKITTIDPSLLIPNPTPTPIAASPPASSPGGAAPAPALPAAPAPAPTPTSPPATTVVLHCDDGLSLAGPLPALTNSPLPDIRVFCSSPSPMPQVVLPWGGALVNATDTASVLGPFAASAFINLHPGTSGPVLGVSPDEPYVLLLGTSATTVVGGQVQGYGKLIFLGFTPTSVTISVTATPGTTFTTAIARKTA